MSNEKTFIRDDVVADIKNRARKDMEFKKMLFANPQEALGQFDFVLPGSSGDGKSYLESQHALFERQKFHRWLDAEILNEFRDEVITMTAGPCVTTTEHEGVDWDFEVTTNRPKPD